MEWSDTSITLAPGGCASVGCQQDYVDTGLYGNYPNGMNCTGTSGLHEGATNLLYGVEVCMP